MVTEKDEKALKRQYARARVAYYNKSPIMTDRAFDRLEDKIRNLDPKWAPLAKTGALVADKKTEVDLFEYMPSLDKVYPEGMTKLLNKPWIRKVDSWIEMHKLDGTSLQLVYEGQGGRLKPTRLITRGDGEKGGDISFFIPWLTKHKRIPATIKGFSARVVFRLEGIMQKAVFTKKWSRKAKKGDGWDNIRTVPEFGPNSKERKALIQRDREALAKFSDLEQNLAAWRLQFYRHKGHSGERGISSLLTFGSYLKLASNAGLTSTKQISNRKGTYQLARYKDIGIYSLKNCRFITIDENQKELTENGGRSIAAQAKAEASKEFFIATDPLGKVYEAENIQKFARTHRLQASNIVHVLKGKRPQHKGWTFEYCEPPKIVQKDTGYDNVRNMVNGVFNRKDEHPALKDIDLVVLGVYGYSIASGLYHARDWGFQVVDHTLVRQSAITAPKMSQKLESERKTSPYEMDGLVFGPAGFKLSYVDNKRPKQLLAFKFNDEANADQVVVKSVIWQKSRLKRWIPKINIEPTQMDGVMVRNAAAHNAAWLKEKGIGPGAVVKVLRSGGVIPKIVGVVKKAKFVSPPGPYELKGRFFYMLEHDKTSEVRGIHHFMTTLGIELLAAKTLSKLYDVGLTTTESYIKLTNASERVALYAMKDAELGPKQTAKILAELRRGLTSTITLKNLMVASGCFERGGMGRGKLEQLEAQGLSMADLCNTKRDLMVAKITEYKGFSEKTAVILRDGVTQFRAWYKPVSKLLTVDGDLPVKKKAMGGPLKGVKVAFTSYRSEEQEAKIVALGGEVVGYGPKMGVLLWKQGAKFMDKIDKAGSKAMHWDAFCKKYGVR